MEKTNDHRTRCKCGILTKIKTIFICLLIIININEVTCHKTTNQTQKLSRIKRGFFDSFKAIFGDIIDSITGNQYSSLEWDEANGPEPCGFALLNRANFDELDDKWVMVDRPDNLGTNTFYTLLDEDLGDAEYAKKGCEALGKYVTLGHILDDYDFEVTQQLKKHKPEWYERSIWLHADNKYETCCDDNGWIRDEAKKINRKNYWGMNEPNSDNEKCVELFGGDQSSYNNGRMNDVTCDKDRSYALCETRCDPCHPNPCWNQGMCIEAQPQKIEVPGSPASPLGALTQFNIQCDCQDGFEGNFCETEVTPTNPCGSSPCAGAKLNIKQSNGAPVAAGECSSSTDLKSYTCQCLLGLEGENCDNDIDYCSSNPCKNGGKCADLSTTQGRTIETLKVYECDCSGTGFEGVNCDMLVDECSPNPCKNNGECTDKINSFECDCKPGYEGETCDNSINECASNPCSTHVLPISDDNCPGNTDVNQVCCLDLNNEYECVCKKGSKSSNPKFTNPNKSDKCDVDILECDSNPCKNGGNCVEDSDANKLDFFRCECAEGWTGDLCQKTIDFCENVDCGEETGGGSCKNGATGYTCNCNVGFEGENCEVDIDECASSPCWPYGRCRQSGSINWYPEFLRLKTQPQLGSDGTPLRAGLSQSDPYTASPGYYICSNCRKGFTSKNGLPKSKNCELDYDECLSNPCKKGTCIDSLAWQEYAPKNEEFIKNKFGNDIWEEFKKSGNRIYDFYYWINYRLHDGEDVLKENTVGETTAEWQGITIETGVFFWDHFGCQCDAGWTGKLCDEELDECASDPCGIGVCVDLDGSFECTCSVGIEKDETGKCSIDIDECQSNPCVNGECQKSLIITQLNYYHCLCLPGFTGLNCETDINECSSNPCGNRGNCVDLTGEFKCECIFGYTGPSCATQIDACESSPCQNYGTCVMDGPGAYKCNCPMGADSSDSSISRNLKCDADIDECLSNPCKNGGTCENVQNQLDLFRCSCIVGWTGLKKG